MVHVFPATSKPYPISFKGVEVWEKLLGGPFQFVKSKIPTSLLVVPVKPTSTVVNTAATELLADPSTPITGLCLFGERLDVFQERWYPSISWKA